MIVAGILQSLTHTCTQIIDHLDAVRIKYERFLHVPCECHNSSKTSMKLKTWTAVCCQSCSPFCLQRGDDIQTHASASSLIAKRLPHKENHATTLVTHSIDVAGISACGHAGQEPPPSVSSRVRWLLRSTRHAKM